MRVQGRGEGVRMTEMLVVASTEKAMLIAPMCAESHDVEKGGCWVARSLLLWGDDGERGDVTDIVVPDWFMSDARYSKWFDGDKYGDWKRA